MSLSREIILVRHGSNAFVAIADLPPHRQAGDFVEFLTSLLPLDLAVPIAEMLARERGLPISTGRPNPKA